MSLDLQALGMRLGEAIAPTPSDASQVGYGTVAAVNADGTLDVELHGATLRGLCATTGCVGAQAGMRCVVLRQGPLATVVGLIANADLGSISLPNGGLIYGTDTGGNARVVFDALNANGNTAIGYGGYAESQGYTNVYGNVVRLISRDGVTVDGKYLPKGKVSVGHWSNSSSVTTTSSATIGTFTHASETGKVLVIADMTLQTSRYTSSIQVYEGSNNIGGSRTNQTSPIRMVDIRHYAPTRGTSLTYSLRMNSQDTGTTATFPAYNTAELIVMDI